MPNSHRPSIRGKRYLVSSLHYLATMAGVRILESGGNAADAGVATGICINVLQPGSAHFGVSHQLSTVQRQVHPLKRLADSDGGPKLRRWTTSTKITTAIYPREFSAQSCPQHPMGG